MRTIDKIITKVSCEFGAPMGRANVDNRDIILDKNLNPKIIKLFDCAVPMSKCGAYDKGGAYWGTGAQLRVQYNKELTYIRFYRKGEGLC